MECEYVLLIHVIGSRVQLQALVSTAVKRRVP